MNYERAPVVFARGEWQDAIERLSAAEIELWIAQDPNGFPPPIRVRRHARLAEVARRAATKDPKYRAGAA